jgi:hypothetical protein
MDITRRLQPFNRFSVAEVRSRGGSSYLGWLFAEQSYIGGHENKSCAFSDSRRQNQE